MALNRILANSSKAFILENADRVIRIAEQILAWHLYLYEKRDPLGLGLVYIRHPWASGQDNLPVWDDMMDKLQIKKSDLPDPKYVRRDLKPDGSNRHHRPTDQDYDRYYYLLAEAQKHQYDDSKLAKGFPFLAIDVLFNVILVQASIEMDCVFEVLAGALSKGDPLQKRLKSMQGTIKSLQAKRKQSTASFELLWNERLGQYSNVDLNKVRQLKSTRSLAQAFKESQVSVKVLAGHLPLLAGIPSKTRGQSMVTNLFSSYMDSTTGYGLTTTAKTAKNKDGQSVYDPARYWKGPIWINMNWMFIDALDRFPKYLAHQPEALNKLVQTTVDLVADDLQAFDQGVYEYFNPETGKGVGINHFSWSSALIVDLLHRFPKRFPRKK